MRSKFLYLIIFLLAIVLRFWQLGQNPASLYWDEAAIALDAYSISHTGKDMNNHHWLTPTFGSYGDFKAPVLIWLTSLSVKVFGMQPWAIRLPVAVASVLTVFLVGILVKQLLSFDVVLTKRYKLLPLLSAFIVAISPWPVHFGRIGFESSLSVALLLLALISFFKAIRSSAWFLLLSAAFASLAIYSYYSLRLIVPLVAFGLAVYFIKDLLKKKVAIVFSAVFFLLSLWPLISSPYYASSQDYRLNNNNLLRPTQIVLESSEYLERYHNAWYARILYHRYVFWFRDFIVNLQSHFSFKFLFFGGDSNLRQHSGYFGEFLLMSIPFYLIGLYLLWRYKHSALGVTLLLIMATAAIPAAMVYEVPHASRSIYLFIPFSILIALGLTEISRKKWWFALSISALLLNAVVYFADYFIEYPKRSSEAWLYSYNQVAAYLADHYQEYRHIEIDEHYWFPNIFVYYHLPMLLDHSRDLKGAMLNSSINSFGLPEPFQYLLDSGAQYKKEAKFIHHASSNVTDDYKMEREFPFLNGEESLKLYVKEGKQL